MDQAIQPEQILSPKLDVVFKMLFGSEKNKHILKAFLSDMLEIPESDLHNITVKNPEIDPESINEKYYRLDLNIDIGKDLINVELQIRYEEFFAERSLIYLAKLYSSQLDLGEEYSKTCPCIAVNIVDFLIFNQHDDFRSMFEMWDTEHQIKLTDKMQVYFFELKKIKTDIQEDIAANDRKRLWLQFIKSTTREEFEMLKHSEIEPITDAVNALYSMSTNEKIKETVRMRQKALNDKISELAAARREGIAEGEVKGRAEGRDEVIRKMRARGMTESEIQSILNM